MSDPHTMRLNTALRRCITKVHQPLGSTVFLSFICTNLGEPITHTHTHVMPIANARPNSSGMQGRPGSSSRIGSSSTASTNRPNSSTSHASSHTSTTSSQIVLLDSPRVIEYNYSPNYILPLHQHRLLDLVAYPDNKT